jgi:hypothetical protein
MSEVGTNLRLVARRDCLFVCSCVHLMLLFAAYDL